MKKMCLLFFWLLSLSFAIAQDLDLSMEPRYNKLEKLGAGTYGVVLRKNDRSVIKVSILNLEEARATTNLREAALLLSFDHPHIQKPHKVKIHQGVEGKYLEIHLPYLKPLQENDLPLALQEMVMLLASLHEANIAHLDIKPPHIRTDGERIFLVDWGAAETFTARPEKRSRTTLWYRSPESLCGNQTLTKENDMWQLGISLLEMLHRKPIFVGKNRREMIECIGSSCKNYLSFYKMEKMYKEQCFNDIEYSSTIMKPFKYSPFSNYECIMSNLISLSPKQRSSASQLIKQLSLEPKDSLKIKVLPLQDIFAAQKLINSGMRQILYIWLHDLSDKYSVSAKIFFDTMTICDRFIQSSPITRENFQLVGIISLFIALEFNARTISIKNLIYETDNSHTKKAFEQKFYELISAAKFELFFNNTLRKYQHEIYNTKNDKKTIKIIGAFLMLLEMDPTEFTLSIEEKWEKAKTLVFEAPQEKKLNIQKLAIRLLNYHNQETTNLSKEFIELNEFCAHF